MFFNTLKAIFISLSLIVLIHYLYVFFKKTLTVPKVKDLVNKPAKQYNEMFDVMNNVTVGAGTGAGGAGRAGTGTMTGTGGAGTGGAGTGTMTGTGGAGTGGAGTGTMKGGAVTSGVGTSADASAIMQDELKNFLKELKKPQEYTGVNKNMPVDNTFYAANHIMDNNAYAPY